MKAGDGKPRSEARRARKKIEFRVTDDQYTQLQTRSRAAGLNGPNDFARATAFGSDGYDAQQKRVLIGELGRIGADLRTLTRQAESRGDKDLAHKEQEAAEAVLELMRDIAGTPG